MSVVEPPGAAEATTGSSVLVGGVWRTVTALVPAGYALAQSVAAARVLGPDGMGLQSFIAFAQFAVVSLLSLGVSTALMRFIGERLGAGHGGEIRDLVRWGWRIELVGAAIGGGALAAVALAGADPRAAWFLAAVAASLSIMHAIPTAILIGAQRWRAASIVGLITGTLATGGIIVVLALGWGITGMFAVEAAIAAINLVWTGALATRALRTLAPVRKVKAPEDVRRAVREYTLLATATSLVTFIVWRRSELFFLEHYSTNAEIAFYSIAFSVMTTLVAIPQALSFAVSPAVATLSGAGQADRIRSGYGRGFRLLLLVTLPVTAAALTLGPPTIRVVWGSEYSPSTTVFLILISPLPLIALFDLSRGFLTGLGILRVPLAITATAGAANLGLDVLLIPRWDALGAAFANVAAQLCAGIPLLLYSRRRIGGIRWEFGSIFRAAAASAAAAGVAWGAVELLGDTLGLVAGAVGGLATFVALAAAFRILPADDAEWLGEFVGRRAAVLGGVVRSWGRAAG